LVDWASEGDLDDVVVAVSMGVIAFAVDGAVLLRGEGLRV
jgi:hypothetical protein